MGTTPLYNGSRPKVYCSRCGQHRKGRLKTGVCEACYHREAYATKPQLRKNKADYQRRAVKENPDKMRKIMMESRHRCRCRKWGITEEEYEAQMLLGCELCGSKESLHFDHNHKTNQFRGLLCNTCNRALGLFKDDPDILMDASEYVRLR